MMLLSETCSNIGTQDFSWRKEAIEYIKTLVMPEWALGRLLDMAVDMVGITRRLNIPVKRKVVGVFAGDHGITKENVTSFPQSVTTAMVKSMISGGAAISVLSRTFGVDVRLVDMGVAEDITELYAEGVINCSEGKGTKNFRYEPAMTREQAVRAVESGIRLALELGDSHDVFATGEMGIGNTTPSAAIGSILTGVPVSKMVGPGAGLPSASLAWKARMIQEAIQFHKPNPTDGIDVLSKVGGFEIAGLTGWILGAASMRKIVVIDGFISTAAALIAQTLSPTVSHFMIFSHCSAEPGHISMLDRIGVRSLLDLDLRLGEGTGAVLAMPLLDAMSALLEGMATFSSIGIHAPPK